MSVVSETEGSRPARSAGRPPAETAARRAATARLRRLARPRLRLEDYFAGSTHAWGVFQDRFGRLRRQFEVAIDGAWDGRCLTLTEDFAYDDGASERRVWRIRPEGTDGYHGTAGEVIGAARGRVVGNELHWRYRFSLALGARRLAVTFDDRFFLQADGKLINRARVSKFGLLLGEATIVFAKPRAVYDPVDPPWWVSRSGKNRANPDA